MSGETVILGGRYHLGRILGTGGMAEVFLAEDTRLHRTVAVKVLRPGIEQRFQKDLDSYVFAARMIERFHAPSRRLRPIAVVDTLAIKCERALDAAGCDTLVVAGGVGANRRLRARLDDMARRRGGRVCFPRPALCTDNGAMIAFAGALRLQAGQREDASVKVAPRWDMASLPAV